MRVRSPGQEDPLEEEMATHPRTPAWRIPLSEEPGGLQSTGSQSQTTSEQLTHLRLIFHYTDLLTLHFVPGHKTAYFFLSFTFLTANLLESLTYTY